MAFQVAELSFQLVELLRPLMPRIRQRDRSLAEHIVRAASSVALNIAEGDHSDPGNRRARFFTASGSASETLAALRLATAWGYLPVAETEAPAALLRHIIAILRKLTRR